MRSTLLVVNPMHLNSFKKTHFDYRSIQTFLWDILIHVLHTTEMSLEGKVCILNLFNVFTSSLNQCPKLNNLLICTTNKLRQILTTRNK